MKALKGLLIYIGIVLGAILGIGLILLCIMYFVPSFRIAGIGMIHYNETVDKETISLSDYTYDSIVINVNTEKVDIKVVPTEETNISYGMKLNIFGISTEIVEYKIIKQMAVYDGVLNIFLNVTEPDGWISTSTSAVSINVPTSMNFGLVANTENGVVTVGDDELPILLTDLSVSTGKGDLKLINVGAGAEEKSLTLNTLSLTTQKGVFDFSQINNLTVLNNVKLVASDGKFVFKNLYASVDVTGNGIYLVADKIACGTNGFSFIAKNGHFDFNSLSCDVGAENTIIAENIALDIENITGKTGVVTSYGDIKIGTLNSYTILENEHGNVYVKTARDNIIVKTYMGDISVDAYYATGKFSSNKGTITVYSCGDFNAEYYTEIKCVDGNVKVKNEINRLLLTTTGRSDVTVAFGKVKAGYVFQHKINTSTQGDCVIYMPTVNVQPYRFVAKGIISGEVGMNISASESDQYYPSDNTANKQAAVSNCCFEFIGKIKFKGHTHETLSGLNI